MHTIFQSFLFELPRGLSAYRRYALRFAAYFAQKGSIRRLLAAYATAYGLHETLPGEVKKPKS
jgi:hypothetical protein